MSEKWTTKNIPDLSGKTALVTGANIGLGYESTKALAVSGACVIMVCRNENKAFNAHGRLKEELGAEVKLDVKITDLSDLQNVEQLCKMLRREYSQLDILINNAGLMMPPYEETAQGFEQQWGINHLAAFVLTARLMPLLKKVPEARVIALSSLAAKKGQIYFDDINQKENYSPWKLYSQSKLADLMFALELAQKLENSDLPIKSIAAHPGISNTNLFETSKQSMNKILVWLAEKLIMPMITQDAGKGVLPQLFAATAPEAENGSFYGPDGGGERRGYPAMAKIPPQALDEKMRERFWHLSEKQTGIEFKVE